MIDAKVGDGLGWGGGKEGCSLSVNAMEEN